MEARKKPAGLERQPAFKRSFNINNYTKKLKFTPYGKALAERQKYQNLPVLVFVCAGKDAWPRARHWNASPNDVCAMVWDGENPARYRWPVAGCACVVDWNTGPSPEQITDLIRELIRSGAVSVTSRPLSIDPRIPAYRYDTTRPLGDRWVQTREMIRTYTQPRWKGVQDAA